MAYEVTIGIPVFNVEAFIRQTLDVALAQTFENIEYLICDDCGSDGSIRIVEEYQRQHPRGSHIRILHQPHNMGIGAGRNRIMDEAQGKYIYFMDADDTIELNTIELLYNTAKKYDAEIVYGSYDRVFTEEGQVVRTVSCAYPAQVFTEEDTFADYVYQIGIQCMNWNYLLDLDIIRRNHLRVAEVGHGYGEDFTFTIDLPTYIQRAVLLPDVTYHYFHRNTSKPKPRKILSRKYMTLAIKSVNDKKSRRELLGKRYYSKRISHLMMFLCSFACEMVVRREEFDEPFTNREVRDIMRHPMTFWEIVTSNSGRFRNMLYWSFGVVPPTVCAWMLRLMAKRYGLKKQ